MPRIRNPQLKNFCFTLNNYTEEEYESIKESLQLCSNYFVLGKEVGEQGTSHIQGYCSLSKRTYFAKIKSLLSGRAHIEPAKGTGHDNRTYCSKEGDFFEWGEIPKETKKRTRDELSREFKVRLGEGRSGISQFADDNPGVFSWSGHTLLRNALGITGAIPRPNINVRWIWGPPGVGKSRLAHEEYPNAYIKDPRTKWWNGYCLEKEVIIDDFGPNGIDINHLLRWFDRYKCYVEIKGDMCPLLAESFIVTSNFLPCDCFKDKDGNIHPQTEALLRRLNVIYME